MRIFLRRIYNGLTAHLYNRLLRDLTIQLQEAQNNNLAYQETLAAKMLDELVCVRLELQSVLAATKKTDLELSTQLESLANKEKISDDEIHDIVNQISSHIKIVELAAESQIPMSQIFEWRSKYTGLTVKGVRKMRQIERENEFLREALLRLRLENQQSAEPEKV